MVVVTDASGDQSEAEVVSGPTVKRATEGGSPSPGMVARARRLDTRLTPNCGRSSGYLGGHGGAPKARQPRLVFVIVDASSAAYALNKGRVGGLSADMAGDDGHNGFAGHSLYGSDRAVGQGITTLLLTRFPIFLLRFLLL